jgi:hypothetical protein
MQPGKAIGKTFKVLLHTSGFRVELTGIACPIQQLNR